MTGIKKANNQNEVLEMVELFDTTPERLFKAWINKKDFSSWYGPEGFDVTHCELDVKIGGKWRVCIAAKNGEEYWMEGKYIEIVEPEKLVFTFNDGSENKDPDKESVVALTFSRSGTKTIMNFRQEPFASKGDRDSHNGGWASAFRCLRNELTKSK